MELEERTFRIIEPHRDGSHSSTTANARWINWKLNMSRHDLRRRFGTDLKAFLTWLNDRGWVTLSQAMGWPPSFAELKMLLSMLGYKQGKHGAYNDLITDYYHKIRDSYKPLPQNYQLVGE